MAEPYYIPRGEGSSKIIVKGSRFIGRAAFTPTVASAKEFIEKIRQEEPGCTHVVYAYIIGYGNSVTLGMSDAGEPSGTAGRPVLEVLKGSGLGDITLVVVRYFGGTKLGTGGLARAYSQSAKETLEGLDREEKVEKASLTVILSYDLFNPCASLTSELNGEIIEQIFETDVRLKIIFPMENIEVFKNGLKEISAGRVQFE